LDGVLGNIDVPERASQDGYSATVFVPEHLRDVRLGGGSISMLVHSSALRPGG
jgi:hypothetical protein